MTGRRTGPDPYRTTPAGAFTVALAVLATICIAVGAAAGPAAGLKLGVLLVGLPCAGAAVLVILCLAADTIATAVHSRARCRVGLDQIDVESVEAQALAVLARRIRAAANAQVGSDHYDRPARAVRNFARDLEQCLPQDTQGPDDAQGGS